MSRQSRTCSAGLGLICALVLLSPSVLGETPGRRIAKPAAPPSLAQSLQGEAKEAYSSAELLFKNGDLVAADSKYQQAYDLSKDPRLLFDMAIAEKSLHRYARMQEHLEGYVREEGSAISQEDQAAVSAALAAIHNLVGTVSIEVNVPGATVAVDSQNVGTSPLARPLTVDLGEHVIDVKSPDFEPISKKVAIEGGASTAMSFTLTRMMHTGQLSVVAEPGATIEVDGTSVASGRYDGRVTAGTHEVRVTAPGRLAYVANVELHESETRSLQVTLVRQYHGEIWPWIVGGVLVAAGAAVGGYFLLKPRDETNPIPAGTLAGVQLTSWKK
jgi:hypothetical protein